MGVAPTCLLPPPLRGPITTPQSREGIGDNMTRPEGKNIYRIENVFSARLEEFAILAGSLNEGQMIIGNRIQKAVAIKSES